MRCHYRTTDTERSLGEVLEEIRPLLEESGVIVEVRVEKVAGDVSEVSFNGLPLQDLVEEIAKAEAYCSGPSRMEELGHPEIAYDPEVRVGCVVPEIIFRKAVLMALEE
ncbi:hypothetical protein J2129_002177 [Methanofollis sp. W23]|nr:hypothetical protein [Methanofollis sp. W23]